MARWKGKQTTMAPSSTSLIFLVKLLLPLHLLGGGARDDGIQPPRSRLSTAAAFSPPPPTSARRRGRAAAAAFGPPPARGTSRQRSDAGGSIAGRGRLLARPDGSPPDADAPPPPYFARDLGQEDGQVEGERDDAAARETQESTADGSGAPPISGVDARVLASILQDGKLDLSTEDEVKKLLEGPRLREGGEAQEEEEEDDDGAGEDGKYSSRFVSAVSDNAFWNSLRAKADEIIESVGIYIENRIERDSRTLAAVGIFTLDRIRRDVGRALPAAGRQARKLLLATNSSYAEGLLEQGPFALPSERSSTGREPSSGGGTNYEDLATPADEIRQVTEAIRDILSGRELDPSSSSSPGSRRGVRSFAPAGTSRLAERQRRAYKARKKTVLRREREGVDSKVGRAIGSVSDATWELRREMQTGAGREAGYRTRGVRNALAAGAVKLLEAGREGSQRLLEGTNDRRRKAIGGGAEVVGVFGDKLSNTVDVSPLEEEAIIQNVIEEANMEYAPDGLLSPRSFIEEKRRLIASLDSCLSQPSKTWLTSDAVAQAAEVGTGLDGAVLRNVIADMVSLRDGLQAEMIYIEEAQQADYLKMEYVSSELRRMKRTVDSIYSLSVSAAGESAAEMLKRELEGFVLSDSLDDIVEIELERMEQLLAERVAKREEKVQSRRRKQQKRQQRQYQKEVVVEPQQFVDATAGAAAKNAQRNGGTFTEVEVVSSSPNFGQGGGQEPYYMTPDSSGSKVEVVSETEYDEYEQQFKSAQGVVDITGGDYEYADGDIDAEEENPLTDFVLRVADVVFFVGEKFFLVLLPDLITGGERVTSRYACALNRGTGSVGWKPLKNAKTKNIR